MFLEGLRWSVRLLTKRSGFKCEGEVVMTYNAAKVMDVREERWKCGLEVRSSGVEGECRGASRAVECG